MRHIIEDAWKRIHLQRGYDLLYTPHVAKADLWKISGHLDFYKENMFEQIEIEEELYQLRPMNCPYHILVYKAQQHSYRDFPIRVAELGTVYRYELSGSLHGLFRVRGFTQVFVFSLHFVCLLALLGIGAGLGLCYCIIPYNVCGSSKVLLLQFTWLPRLTRIPFMVPKIPCLYLRQSYESPSTFSLFPYENGMSCS